MDDDLHAVLLCDKADMVGSCDCASNGSLLLVIWKTLAGEKGSTTLGDLDDDRRLDVTLGERTGCLGDQSGRVKV